MTYYILISWEITLIFASTVCFTSFNFNKIMSVTPYMFEPVSKAKNKSKKKKNQSSRESDEWEHVEVVDVESEELRDLNEVSVKQSRLELPHEQWYVQTFRKYIFIVTSSLIDLIICSSFLFTQIILSPSASYYIEYKQTHFFSIIFFNLKPVFH